MLKLIINGWHLKMEGVGQGAYAWRLVDGLRRHADSASADITVIVPASHADQLAKKIHPLTVSGRSSLKLGHDILDGLAWHWQLLSEASRCDDQTVFFSPGPCWGLHTPARMAITYHDCIYRHFPVYLGRSGIRRWAVRQSEKFLHRAGLIITESDHARDDIADLLHVAKDKIAVVPAWLPPEFNPDSARTQMDAARKKYHLPDRYWLYLGGYDVRKNIEFMIRAYAAARRQADCPPLVLAGRIPQRTAPTLCDVAGVRHEMGLDQQVLPEPGFIAESDLPALYAGAELFIYPSLMEGYGLPPMEAMGCGCPAIVADNSSLREVVIDRDYRFETSDPEALTALLAQAARKPLPLNPGFDRNRHDEATAIQRYLALLARTPKSL